MGKFFFSGAKGKGSSITTNTWFGCKFRCFFSQTGFEQESKLGQFTHLSLGPEIHLLVSLKQLKQ